ncbi:hypothetical protein BJX62DRAFT_241730 [Aspergillus germanicus]
MDYPGAEDDYVTEHVYEAQTIKYFFEALQKSSELPPGYGPAGNAWVSEVLLGIDTVAGARPPFKYTNMQRDSLWKELFWYLGHNDNFAVLANSPDNKETEAFTRNAHRNNAGVFSYMNNGDIWAIFVDASRKIEAATGEL